MSRQELLPPLSGMPTARSHDPSAAVDVPSVNTGGYFNSRLVEFRSGYTKRATDAVTHLNVSEAALFSAQTQLIETTIKKREALARLHELPERLGHELEVRRVGWANQLREAQHLYEMNEQRRNREEVTHAPKRYTPKQR